MKRFSKLLIKFFPETKKPLGRWNYLKSKKQLDQKIDLSNEDHCGPYALSKSNNCSVAPELEKKI